MICDIVAPEAVCAEPRNTAEIPLALQGSEQVQILIIIIIIVFDRGSKVSWLLIMYITLHFVIAFSQSSSGKTMITVSTQDLPFGLLHGEGQRGVL